MAKALFAGWKECITLQKDEGSWTEDLKLPDRRDKQASVKDELKPSCTDVHKIAYKLA